MASKNWTMNHEPRVASDPNSITQLRYRRTRAANIVRASIASMLSEPAKWDIRGNLTTDPHCLPSWWPFWSDALKRSVIEAVRHARALEAQENAQE